MILVDACVWIDDFSGNETGHLNQVIDADTQRLGQFLK